MDKHLLELLKRIEGLDDPPLLMINPEWYEVFERATVHTRALSHPYHKYNYALRCYVIERGKYLAQTAAIPPNYVMIYSANQEEFSLIKLWDEPIPQLGSIFNNVRFKANVHSKD